MNSRSLIILSMLSFTLASCGGGGSGGGASPQTQSRSSTASISSSSSSVSYIDRPFGLFIDEASTNYLFRGGDGFDFIMPKMKVEGSYQGLKRGQKIYIGVLPSISIFKEDIEISESNKGDIGNFFINLEPVDNIFPGEYSGDLLVLTCADRDCNNLIGDGTYIVPFSYSYLPDDLVFTLKGSSDTYKHDFRNIKIPVRSTLDVEPRYLTVDYYVPAGLELVLPEQMYSDLQVTNFTDSSFDIVLDRSEMGNIQYSYELQLVGERGDTEELILDHDVYPENFNEDEFYIDEDAFSVSGSQGEHFSHFIKVYNPYDRELEAVDVRDADCFFVMDIGFTESGGHIKANGFANIEVDIDLEDMLFKDRYVCPVEIKDTTGNIIYSFDFTIEIE